MDFSQYDKSDSIMRGKNVIVLQNLDGFNSKKILIELSTASSSNFDYPKGELEQYDNLDLTAKVVQACLSEYYLNCIDATTEAAIHMPMYTPFVITVDFVSYHFDDIADFLQRKDTLPFSIDTDVLKLKDICADATFEAAVKLEIDQPFSITINSTRYVFENINDFISKYRDVFGVEIQPTLFVPKKEILTLIPVTNVKLEVLDTLFNEISFTTLEGEVGYTGTELDQILLSDGTIVDIPVTSQTYSFNVPAGTHKVKLVESVDRDNSVRISGEALVKLHNFPTLSTVTHFGFHIGESPSSDNLTKVPNFLPSNITDISYMFAWASSFNQDISGWNVSNVTNMSDMFEGVGSFNQPLNDWDVSNVTDMYSMFYHARSFNQDLSMWCVSKITSAPYGFNGSTPNWTLPKPVWGTCPNR